MRVRTLLVAGWFAAASAGCQSGVGLFQISFRNLYQCPRRAVDTCNLENRCREWAEKNWMEFVADCVEQDFAPPFKEGFSDGFTDYLVYGGKGEPPAVPPYHYQLFGVYTAPGERADEAREWYEGFRTGAARAKMTGLRDQIIIPLSAPPVNAVERRATLADNIRATEGDKTIKKMPLADEKLPDTEVLPAPAMEPGAPPPP